MLVPQRDIALAGVKTDTFFALICFALALWGVAQGAGSSALEALLADSVPTGEHLSPCLAWGLHGRLEDQCRHVHRV